MFFFQLLEAFNSMNKRLSIDGALIKEVSGNDHKVDRTIDRLVHDVPEGAAKIVKTFAHAILLVAQVCICYMNKRSSHESLRFVMANEQVRSSRRENRRQRGPGPRG